MKKIIILALVLLSGTTIFAKSVKFSVDMTGQTLSPNGVHVSGDFQIAAGFIDNWDPATCTMLQEGSTNIYSIVVNIPAFQKYEYRFINGDLFYETEFIPFESQVGYEFNDNRWIYIDSLASDTTIIGAIKYGGNAPEGKKLVRFLVDMSQQSVSVYGVYMAGNYNTWNYGTAALYSFQDSIFEIIQYVTAGSYEYKFANGFSAGEAETVPSGCATNSSRTITVVNDTLLTAVCFSSCFACETGIKDISKQWGTIYPNPSSGSVTIMFNQPHNKVTINDAVGKTLHTYVNYTDTSLSVNNLKSGVYFVNVFNKKNELISYKLIVL